RAGLRYMKEEPKPPRPTPAGATPPPRGAEPRGAPLPRGREKRGEKILRALNEEEKKKKKNRHKLEQLSGDFYTAVPHRIGRTRAAIASAVIDGMAAIQQKQDTLQLMTDMLQVNGEAGNVPVHTPAQRGQAGAGCRVGRR